MSDPITNTDAIRYANERIRVTARRLADLCGTARSFVQEMDEDLATEFGLDYAVLTQTEPVSDEQYAKLDRIALQDGSKLAGQRGLSNMEVLAWFRVVFGFHIQILADDSRIEKLARKIAFGVN